MWYLFLQVWVLLLIAFVLGWLAHWFFCCRNKEQTVEGVNTGASAAGAAVAAGAASGIKATAKAEPVAINDDWKPQGFSSRPDKVDDLKRIKGIGAVIENTLNELGIYQFSQISEWDNDNVTWVDNFISFPGRIMREDWINQAKTLDAGGTTDFAKRVDKGELDY